MKNETAYDRAFRLIVGEEGEFQKIRKDRGNWDTGVVGRGNLKGTKYGISAMAYPHLDIENLTLEQAKTIYYQDYWSRVRGDELPWRWALPLFDCAVNQGVGTAIRLMQDAVGVVVDGKIGPLTMQAIERSSHRQLAQFFAARGRRYVAHPDFATWGNGWFTRLFVISMEAAQ